MSKFCHLPRGRDEDGTVLTFQRRGKSIPPGHHDAAAPLQGHLLSLIPLAAACRAAGHDVILAGGGFPPGVQGLRTADIDAAFSLPRSASRVAVRHPRIARAETRGVAGHAMVGELFGRANLALVGPLLAVAGR